MKMPYNFAEYNLIEENDQVNNLFKVVIFILIIAIIIVISKFKFSIYQQSVLLYDDNRYLVVADINMIDTLSTTNKIIINNKKYDYKIVDASNYSNINGTIYQSVYLDIKDYTSKIKMNKCYFLKSKSTLIDSIIRFTKGG